MGVKRTHTSAAAAGAPAPAVVLYDDYEMTRQLSSALLDLVHTIGVDAVVLHLNDGSTWRYEKHDSSTDNDNDERSTQPKER